MASRIMCLLAPGKGAFVFFFGKDSMTLCNPTIIALAVTLLAAPAAALAEKGGRHGQGADREIRYEDRHDEPRGKKNRDKPDYRQDDRRGDRGDKDRDGRRESRGPSVEYRFGDQDRRLVRDYYGGEAGRGHCPPGLAKKGNGCLPPGQAKKWAMGRPLPRDLRYYELPHDLLVRMPPAPAGHRYVQVAGDILLIAVGSSMVVDAIQDILR